MINLDRTGSPDRACQYHLCLMDLTIDLKPPRLQARRVGPRSDALTWERLHLCSPSGRLAAKSQQREVERRWQPRRRLTLVSEERNKDAQVF